MKGRFDSISIAAKDGTSPAALVRAVQPLVPSTLEVKDSAKKAAEDSAQADKAMSYIRYFLLGFGGIALFVGAFVIFNTLSITVAQRTREFATLRTLGASRKQVLRSVRLEGLAIGLIASVIGLFLGFAIAKGMLVMFSAMGVDLPKADTVFAPRTAIVSILLGTGITLLATVVPARRATRVPPIAAVREGSSLPASRFGARLGPWVVRPMVRLVGWPLRRAGGVAGELAGANAARNPGRTASTAAALTIGLTLVTLVAVLGAGLNGSTTSAISDQLRAGYVLDANQQIPFSAAEGEELARVPGVTAASHVRADKALVRGEETEVTGIDPATIASFYRFAWTKGSDQDPRPARLGRGARDQELRRRQSRSGSAAGWRSRRPRARSARSSCAASMTRRRCGRCSTTSASARRRSTPRSRTRRTCSRSSTRRRAPARRSTPRPRTPAARRCTPARPTRRTRRRTPRSSSRCSTCCSGSRSS